MIALCVFVAPAFASTGDVASMNTGADDNCDDCDDAQGEDCDCDDEQDDDSDDDVEGVEDDPDDGEEEVDEELVA